MSTNSVNRDPRSTHDGTPPLKDAELVPMVIAHLDEILVMENSSFPSPWSRQAFENDLEFNKVAHYWSFMLDASVIGYVGIWVVQKIAHLTTICLKQEYRGNGLGRWLLLETMSRGTALGVERFTLEVREKNVAALNLYESVGYKVVGRRENYYAEIKEDALVMWTGSPPFVT